MFVSSLPTIPVPQILVTSVLSNFICDACTVDDVLGPANREITEHVELLNTYSRSNPGVSIAVAPPLPRSVPDWFPTYLPVFSTFLFHEITRIGNPRLQYMAPFVAPPGYFESDGIHLNVAAGSSFVQYLVTGADQLYPPVIPSTSAANTLTPSSVPDAPLTLSQLAQDVKELRSDVQRRRDQDNLVFARIKEDRDFEINKSREDRCTISGLSIRTAPPSDPKERKEFFKNFMSDLVAEALPDADVPPQVLDVIVNMRSGRGPPFFEVKFESSSSSQAFRIAASKLAKAGTGSFQVVFVSNTVNPSTRIRIDILKVLAKSLTTPTEISYVQGFSSRPTLHYLMRASDPEQGVISGPPTPPTRGTGRSYTFAESMEHWGHLLTPSILEPIRRKALQTFSGCLEQYFVVLRDHVASDVDSNDMFTRLFTSGGSRPAPSRRGGLLRNGRRPPRAPRGHPIQLSGANSVPRPTLRQDIPSSLSQGARSNDPDADVSLPSVTGPPPARELSLKRSADPRPDEAEPSKKK